MESPDVDVTQSPTVMLTVLETKLRAVLGPVVPGDVSRLRRRQEALRWFLQRDRTATFSFERVCEVTGFDPEMMRARVLRVAASNVMRPKKVAAMRAVAVRRARAAGVSVGSTRRTRS